MMTMMMMAMSIISPFPWTIMDYGLECFSLRKADVKSLDFAVVRFLMKSFNSANTDTINTCRWYFDFQLPSEVLI